LKGGLTGGAINKTKDKDVKKSKKKNVAKVSAVTQALAFSRPAKKTKEN